MKQKILDQALYTIAFVVLSPAQMATLACGQLFSGKVAQNTYDGILADGHRMLPEPEGAPVLRMLHPAARTWSVAIIEETKEKVQKILME